MKYKTNSGCHLIHCFQFHYVDCVKYRHKIMIDKIADRLKGINQSVAKHFNIKITEQEIMQENIHINAKDI